MSLILRNENNEIWGARFLVKWLHDGQERSEHCQNQDEVDVLLSRLESDVDISFTRSCYDVGEVMLLNYGYVVDGENKDIHFRGPGYIDETHENNDNHFFRHNEWTKQEIDLPGIRYGEHHLCMTYHSREDTFAYIRGVRVTSASHPDKAI